MNNKTAKRLRKNILKAIRDEFRIDVKSSKSVERRVKSAYMKGKITKDLRIIR